MSSPPPARAPRLHTGPVSCLLHPRHRCDLETIALLTTPIVSIYLGLGKIEGVTNKMVVHVNEGISERQDHCLPTQRATRTTRALVRAVVEPGTSPIFWQLCTFSRVCALPAACLARGLVTDYFIGQTISGLNYCLTFGRCCVNQVFNRTWFCCWKVWASTARAEAGSVCRQRGVIPAVTKVHARFTERLAPLLRLPPFH